MLTVGICRSVSRIVFGTYRGTLTIDLRTLFWNICSISMLELLAVPQRGMPYVQMGLRIVLYISNLFCSVSFDFLPMIQYMRWSCNPSCFLSVKLCLCHVSLRSRWMPKYLAVSVCGLCCPFNHYAPCILYIGQAFRYSPEKAFYIFNQQIYFIIFFETCCTILIYSST